MFAFNRIFQVSLALMGTAFLNGVLVTVEGQSPGAGDAVAHFKLQQGGAMRGGAATNLQKSLESYGKLPLAFEANGGQADAHVQFLSHGSNYSIQLTDTSAVLALGQPAKPAKPDKPAAQQDRVRMTFVGAQARGQMAQAAGEAQLPGRVNYFIGRDTAQWRTDLPTYARIRYAGVYPGVDLVYYGNRGRLEYDFVVAAGADPAPIRLRFDGQRAIRIDADGDLVLRGLNGSATLHKPAIYQKKNGQRHSVSGRFRLLAAGTVAFQIGSYDRSRELVIDPVLSFATYLGGSSATGDQGNGIAVDASGNAYVTGTTYSTDFPVTAQGFEQKSHAATGLSTAFVTKLNASGSALLYSTYVGGSEGDFGYGIGLDAQANAYITGATYSTDFPVTCGALLTANRSATPGAATAFVAKLNKTGNALVYATYLGGSGNQTSPAQGDVAEAIAVNPSGNAYVTGTTWSANFPTSESAFQAHKSSGNLSNAFVTELNLTGTALVYSTYLGGGGEAASAIALDRVGNAFVAGQTPSAGFPVTRGAYQMTNQGAPNSQQTGFLTELNPDGSDEVYSTYLGGSGGDSILAVAVDKGGFAYVAGNTASSDFPLTAGVLEGAASGLGQYFGNPNSYGSTGSGAFLAKLNADGSALVYSTYLQGDATTAAGLAVDGAGDAYVVGTAATAGAGSWGGFVSTPDALSVLGSAGTVGFLAELDPSAATLKYATLLGGSSNDAAIALALDAAGNAYVTGSAASSDFPVSGGAFQKTKAGTSNAFIAKFALAGEANGAGYPAIPTNIATTMTGQASIDLQCDQNQFSVSVFAGFTTAAFGPPPTGTFEIDISGGAVVQGGPPYAVWGQGSGGLGTFLTIDPPPSSFFEPWDAFYSGDSVYAGSSISGNVMSDGCPSSPFVKPLQPSMPETAPLSGTAPSAVYHGQMDASGNSIRLKLNAADFAKSAARKQGGSAPAKPLTLGPKFIPAPAPVAGASTKSEVRPRPEDAPSCIVPKPSITVTILPVAASRPYGAANPAFTFSVAGLLNGDTVNVTPTTTATATSPVGVYPVTAAVSGPAAASYDVYVAEGTLTVLPAPAAVTLGNNWRLYGGANPAFHYQVTGLIGTDAVTVTPATVATAVSPVGSYPITALITGPAANNYRFTVKQAMLNVYKATLAVSAANVNVTYGDAPAQPTAYGISGFLNGDGPGVVSGAPVLSTSVTSATRAGVYRIEVQLGTLSARNYEFSSISSGEGSVYVYKRRLMAIANNQTMHQGGPVPALTYSLSGFVNGDTGATAVTGAPAMFTTATSSSPPGRYPISGNLGTLASANYTFERVTGVMTVLP